MSTPNRSLGLRVNEVDQQHAYVVLSLLLLNDICDELLADTLHVDGVALQPRTTNLVLHKALGIIQSLASSPSIPKAVARQQNKAVLRAIHGELHVLWRAEHTEFLQGDVSEGTRHLKDSVDSAVLHGATSSEDALLLLHHPALVLPLLQRDGMEVLLRVLFLPGQVSHTVTQVGTEHLLIVGKNDAGSASVIDTSKLSGNAGVDALEGRLCDLLQALVGERTLLWLIVSHRVCQLNCQVSLHKLCNLLPTVTIEDGEQRKVSLLR
mmetsp:Transcript_47610/g.85659  ORF Transcript_47610/g.85659 Transcript_47610/m.85659 type:complete len:266 (+) Transcript_47610:224-1021(+)